MELKFRHKKEIGDSAASFNRTFMELKSGESLADAVVLKVLIVPLWN